MICTVRQQRHRATELNDLRKQQTCQLSKRNLALLVTAIEGRETSRGASLGVMASCVPGAPFPAIHAGATRNNASVID
jgi:hypothetical protein